MTIENRHIKSNEILGGLKTPKNIYKKLEDLVAELIQKHIGGVKFFEALDMNIKDTMNKDIVLELVKSFSDEYIISSGEFGEVLYDLHKNNQFKCIDIVYFNGKIATEGKEVSSYYPKSFDLKNKKFVFVDDSYFSGITTKKIDEYLKKHNSKIKQVAVVYNGNKNKSSFVKSFYRYYK